MERSSIKVTGKAVRQGAVYGGNQLFAQGRGGAGGGLGLSISRSLGSAGAGSLFGMRSGGSLGLMLGGGLGGGLGAGLGAGLGLGTGSFSLGGGLSQMGGASGRMIGYQSRVAPLRARFGGRIFKIGRYGHNPAFLTTSSSIDVGISPVPILDPSLPSVDTVQVTRLKEKEELQVLNDKFALFIDKARTLEQQNAILKAKISMFTNPDQGGPASAPIILTSAIGNYKTQIDSLTATKEAIIAEIEHYKGIIEDVQARYEEETSQTKDLEVDWTTLKEEVDGLYLTIFELQTNIGGLEDQIALSKQVYDAKVKEVRNIVTGSVKSAFSISVDNAAQAQDLTTALADVKSHYEALAQRSKQDALLSVQDSLSMMSLSTQPSTHTLTATKEELRLYKLQIDSVQRDIDRLKGLNAQLEVQLEEAETHSSTHTETYQDQVFALKNQLDDIRRQITQYGQEYQDLLASKMSLEVEITAYKKLLDSEESRLRSGGGVTVSMSQTASGGAAGGGAGGGFGFSLASGGGVASGGGLGMAGLGLGLGTGGLNYGLSSQMYGLRAGGGGSLGTGLSYGGTSFTGGSNSSILSSSSAF